jgi:phage gpG-like protein
MNAKKAKTLRKVAEKAFKEQVRPFAIKKWKKEYKEGKIEIPNHDPERYKDKTTIS